MKYARIENNIVVEIFIAIDGFSIDQCFHSDLVAKMISCPTDAQTGWHYKSETGQFSEDGEFPSVEIPEPPPTETSA